MRLVQICFIVISLGIFSCSKDEGENSKELNESTATKAIDAYFSENPAVIKVPVTFPADLAIGVRKAKGLEVLETLGVLSSTAIEVLNPDSFGRISKPKVPGKKYQLTTLGKSLLVSEDQGSGGFMKSTSFKVADYQVEKINQLGEPADANGHVVSHVTFTYRSVNENKALTQSAAAQQEFPQLKKSLGPDLSGKTTLIKTAKGWVHEKSFK